MSRYLVDTDTITLIQFGHSAAVRNLASHADTDVVLAVVEVQRRCDSIAHIRSPRRRRRSSFASPVPRGRVADRQA